MTSTWPAIGDVYEMSDGWYYWEHTGGVSWDGHFYESSFGPFDTEEDARADLAWLRGED